MLVSEMIEYGQRVRHYSDLNMKIIQNETGNVYDDAVDVLTCKYTYSETGKPIEVEDVNEVTEADYLAALERLGVSEYD